MGKLNGLMNWWSKDLGNKGTAFFYGDERPYIYQAAVITLASNFSILYGAICRSCSAVRDARDHARHEEARRPRSFQ